MVRRRKKKSAKSGKENNNNVQVIGEGGHVEPPGEMEQVNSPISQHRPTVQVLVTDNQSPVVEDSKNDRYSLGT